MGGDVKRLADPEWKQGSSSHAQVYNAFCFLPGKLSLPQRVGRRTLWLRLKDRLFPLVTARWYCPSPWCWQACGSEASSNLDHVGSPIFGGAETMCSVLHEILLFQGLHLPPVRATVFSFWGKFLPSPLPTLPSEGPSQT